MEEAKTTPQKSNVSKTETLKLWWYDKEEKQYYSAGVAFYDDKFGEYRLKIDMHPETTYYLRPVNVNDSQTYYRVEVVIKKNGRFKCRRMVGEGYSNKLTNDDIFIQLGPYKKFLVLGKEGENHNEE